MLKDRQPAAVTLEPLDDHVVIETTGEEAERRGGLIVPASAEACPTGSGLRRAASGAPPPRSSGAAS